MRRMRAFACATFMLLLCWATGAHAHKPSDSYLTLQVHGETIDGQWDIALRDLDFAMGLDADGNGEITWNEVRARHAAIAAYALSRLNLTAGGKPCPLQPTQHLVDSHTDGTYEVLRFHARCEGNPDTLTVAYRLFFDVDLQHKGLLRLVNEGQTATAIFSASDATRTLALREPGRLHQLGQYIYEGVWHIWLGFDHILFLLSLLFPAVLQLRDKKWQPAGSFKASFLDVLKVVTAFTVAHSITLTLATLHVISLPSRWVESAIALSVIVAALNNIFPLVQSSRWIAAFAFGLIHGFGFASVLADLGLPQNVLLLALVGFNFGVELGQLAIVSLFLPAAYVLRKTWFYRGLVFHSGSAIIALVASVWLTERLFNLQLLGF